MITRKGYIIIFSNLYSICYNITFKTKNFFKQFYIDEVQYIEIICRDLQNIWIILDSFKHCISTIHYCYYFINFVSILWYSDWIVFSSVLIHNNNWFCRILYNFNLNKLKLMKYNNYWMKMDYLVQFLFLIDTNLWLWKLRETLILDLYFIQISFRFFSFYNIIYNILNYEL